MAKARKRRKTTPSGGAGFTPAAPRKKASTTANLALVVLVVAVVGGAAWWIWSQNRAAGSFDALAKAGKDKITGIATDPDFGTRHLAPGEGYNYGKQFPTSGPHAPEPTPPGFYGERPPMIGLVHALEHGNIVIYYDRPGDAAMKQIKAWTSLFGGIWDGVLAVPDRSLGQRIELLAWRHRLELAQFDPKTAAAFIDKFRGRGPENPVR